MYAESYSFCKQWVLLRKSPFAVYKWAWLCFLIPLSLIEFQHVLYIKRANKWTLIFDPYFLTPGIMFCEDNYLMCYVISVQNIDLFPSVLKEVWLCFLIPLSVIEFQHVLYIKKTVSTFVFPSKGQKISLFPPVNQLRVHIGFPYPIYMEQNRVDLSGDSSIGSCIL